jgi:hypothetical protein
MYLRELEEELMDSAHGCIKTIGIVALVVVILLLGVASGCSSFKKQTEVNLTPFAEQTITMAGNVNYGFMSVRAVYVRQYADEIPELLVLRSMIHEIRRVMRGIVAYSIQVVTLSQASKTGPEQAQGLADFIEELVRPVVEQKNVRLRLDEAEIDQILSTMRQRETLLDALRVAQPLIDEVAYVAEAFFNEYKVQQRKTIEAFDVAIDEEFAPILSYEQFLRSSQANVLTNLELLYEYWKGDDTALQKLREREMPALSNINISDGLSMTELVQAEDILIDRMATITALRNNIKPQITLYARQKKELQDLNFEMDQTLQRTKAAITIWQRTHRAMAAGITYPADVNLFEISKKIVEVALPF